MVCYWFERARAQIEAGRAKRAGLLATNSIRGGANRKVLERIKTSGDIFWAQSNRDWILEGAAVRVSMVGFDGGEDRSRSLDGVALTVINSDLTGTVDLTVAQQLAENMNIAFMGDTKGGAFDINVEVADQMLSAPLNPNARPNSEVVRPWVNGLDMTRRPRRMWIIDFGTSMSEATAAQYELPFEYVRKHVKPDREKNNRLAYREHWWLHAEPRPAMRASLVSLSRYVATTAVSKHRMFVWLTNESLPDHASVSYTHLDVYKRQPPV